MLFVKTYLDKSKIEGIGVFAEEPISKGTVIWKFFPGFDVKISDVDFAKLPEVAKSWVSHYGYYSEREGGHIICVDNAKFFNHSTRPNTDNTDKELTIASRDIKKGEELTCNYFEFDQNAKTKLSENL